MTYVRMVGGRYLHRYLCRSLLGNEELDHSNFIVLSSIVEGRLLLVVNEVLAEIITFKEYSGNVNVPLSSRYVHGHDIAVIWHTGVRSVEKKNFHCFQVSTFNSKMHWSVQSVVTGLHQLFGSGMVAPQNFLDDLNEAFLACRVEWSLKVFIPNVHIGIVIQQFLHNGQDATVTGLMKGSILVVVLHIDAIRVNLYTQTNGMGDKYRSMVWETNIVQCNSANEGMRNRAGYAHRLLITHIPSFKHTQPCNTLKVLQQLLHSWHVASGTGHVQRGDSLVVFGHIINGPAAQTLSICPKQQLDYLTAGGLCITGTFGLCDCVTGPGKVASSKVQWSEAFFGEDIGICAGGGGDDDT